MTAGENYCYNMKLLMIVDVYLETHHICNCHAHTVMNTDDTVLIDHYIYLCLLAAAFGTAVLYLYVISTVH